MLYPPAGCSCRLASRGTRVGSWGTLGGVCDGGVIESMYLLNGGRMDRKVDLFDRTYRDVEAEVLARGRRKTVGEDVGQNSWTAAGEYRRWAEWVERNENAHGLEVASGSGGPAVFLAELSGARITG